MVILYISFPNNIPPIVPKQKDINPNTIIDKVFKFKKLFPVAVAPTDKPSNIVIMFNSSFWAVLESLEQTPLSFSKFPSISIPTSVAASGTSSETTMVVTIGNNIFSVLETGLS